MKTLIHRLLSAGIVASILAAPSLSFATNGMYLIGFGAKSRGMGGAAYGLYEDSLISAVNPAGIAHVEGTMRVDAGIMLFNPERAAACCNAPNGEVSGATLYAIPNMGMTYKFNRKVSMGFGFVGAGGGGTRYNFNFFNPNDEGSLGVNLMQAIMSPTVSYNITKKQSIGVSPLIAIQTFRAFGLQPFQQFSQDKDKVTNNGNDWSYGAGIRFGYQGLFFDDKFSFGAVYSSKIYMTEFDRYAGLFAGQGDLDIPENYGLGIALRPTDQWTFGLDWQHYSYEDVPSVGNRSLPISVEPGSPNNMGAITGPGFGWQDMDVFKIGAQYEWNDRWTLRTGYNYGKSPIRNSGGEMEFAVLAPATVEHAITAGGTYNLSQSMEISFAFMHAFRNRQTAFVPSGTGLPFEDQDIWVEMKQNAWEISFAYKM